MSRDLFYRPQVFALTNRRAEADRQELQRGFPSVRFVAASPDTWRQQVDQADAVLLGRGIPIDALLDHAPRLHWIQTESAGVDRLLTPRLRANHVLLTNSAGVHAVPIAEHVRALLFAFARQLPELGRAQAKRQWTRPAPGTVFELQGQTLAVIGLGAIGRALAQKAYALGLRVLGVRRTVSEETFPGIEKIFPIAEIDAALVQADHVAICLPLTDATRGLFDDARFARLQPGAYLYNIGRGAIIETPALLRVLESGRLAGAGLDVTSPEPLPPDSPLWSDPRVIITNHTSGGSPRSSERTLEIVRENIARALRGEALRNRIDKTAGY